MAESTNSNLMLGYNKFKLTALVAILESANSNLKFVSTDFKSTALAFILKNGGLVLEQI